MNFIVQHPHSQTLSKGQQKMDASWASISRPNIHTLLKSHHNVASPTNIEEGGNLVSHIMEFHSDEEKHKENQEIASTNIPALPAPRPSNLVQMPA